jgi:hypothetical protein
MTTEGTPAISPGATIAYPLHDSQTEMRQARKAIGSNRQPWRFRIDLHRYIATTKTNILTKALFEQVLPRSSRARTLGDDMESLLDQVSPFRRSASFFGDETSVAFVLAAKLGRAECRENTIARAFRPRFAGAEKNYSAACISPASSMKPPAWRRHMAA